MTAMVSPDGREVDIVADGVDAMKKLGWEVVDAEPEAPAETEESETEAKPAPKRTLRK